jgi:hypothetical protein
MFFDLPDPDPSLVVRIRILPISSKNSKKNLYFFCFVTSLFLKNDVKIIKQKNLGNTKFFFVGILKVTEYKSRSGSGSVNQLYGSPEPGSTVVASSLDSNKFLE